MIGAMGMHPRQPGPCVICGGTDYDLSCGGPTICPKCDCGNFDSATVLKQAKVIAELRSDLAEAERDLDAFGKVSPQQYEKELAEYRVECAESNRLAATNFRRAKLAEAEIQRLRDAIQSLHRVWFTGPDVDKSAVAAACLSLFVVAAPQIPSALPPADPRPAENTGRGQS